MRRISARAAIFAIPTMVAGVYGMNFVHMPELGWSYGYPPAVGLMALAAGALYRASAATAGCRTRHRAVSRPAPRAAQPRPAAPVGPGRCRMGQPRGPRVSSS
ncbi:CorA family divalent cation transporter [Streptomyces avidinii]|uniref:CorA family divalent cation transporter n=1 Tax=Streptomyces avidinii TaxID=1895 RepID=UPI003870D61F